jgi:hypothetical protein
VVEHAALGVTRELQLDIGIGLDILADALEVDVRDVLAHRVPLQLTDHRRLDSAGQLEVVEVDVATTGREELVLVDREVGEAAGTDMVDAARDQALRAELLGVTGAELGARRGLEGF